MNCSAFSLRPIPLVIIAAAVFAVAGCAEDYGYYRTLFRGKYPNPVIETVRASTVPGIVIVDAYDHSQIAEDPLIPGRWLVAGGRVFESGTAGVTNALRASGFRVKNERDAIAAARLFVDGDRSLVIVDTASCEHYARFIPKSKLAMVRDPSAEKNGGCYAVSLYCLHDEPGGFRTEPRTAYLYRLHADVGVWYAVSFEELWTGKH